MDAGLNPNPQPCETPGCFERILALQTTLEAEITPRLHLTPDQARRQWRAGKPLLTAESLSVPVSFMQNAFAGLRPLLPPHSPAQTTLDYLLDSTWLAPATFPALLRNLLPPNPDFLQKFAAELPSDPDTVCFLLHTALTPYLERQVSPYRAWLDQTGWRRGVCPMCGAEPEMARLTLDDGRRMLACPLCRTEWAFDRLRCPFCRQNTQPRMRYFVIDGDDAHRVACCDCCRRYLKTIDERLLGHPANLPLESVLSARLDVIAVEEGYH